MQKAKDKPNKSELTLSSVVYSIICYGIALFSLIVNFTANIPLFRGLRVSPLFMVSFFLLFMLIRVLLIVSKSALLPLFFAQIALIAANFSLRYIYLRNEKLLGFISEYIFYFTLFFCAMSVVFLVAFVLNVRRELARIERARH